MTTKLRRLQPRLSVATITRGNTATTRTQRDRTGRYQRLRESVLYDAQGLCQCAECTASGRPRIASVVDHIVPLWQGGSPSDRSNLQALSNYCHAAKTDAETEERARLAAGVRPGGGL